MKFKKYSEIFKTMYKSMQDWLDDTLAVLVLYKMPLHKAVAFNSILTALKKNNYTLDWFVYDNSPSYQKLESNSESKYIFVHDPINAGVSKAYNQGFITAKKAGKKWLLLLDQDTVFTEDSIEKYYSGMVKHQQESCFVPQLIDKNGIVSPFRFGLGNGIRINSVKDGIHSFKKLKIVNSGIMISVKIFDQSSGYDEDFPLDFSDYAFVDRLQRFSPTFVLIPLTLHHHHSSTSNEGFVYDLKRFHTYYNSARLFMNKYHPENKLILIHAWMRAIKLCMKYKTLKFILLNN